MQIVSNRPKKSQIFTCESSCYELGWAPVNPSGKKVDRLLKLFPKLEKLAFQFSNLILQTRNFTLQPADPSVFRRAAGYRDFPYRLRLAHLYVYVTR